MDKNILEKVRELFINEYNELLFIKSNDPTLKQSEFEYCNFFNGLVAKVKSPNDFINMDLYNKSYLLKDLLSLFKEEDLYFTIETFDQRQSIEMDINYDPKNINYDFLIL